jgi:hypothetical protein
MLSGLFKNAMLYSDCCTILLCPTWPTCSVHNTNMFWMWTFDCYDMIRCTVACLSPARMHLNFCIGAYCSAHPPLQRAVVACIVPTLVCLYGVWAAVWLIVVYNIHSHASGRDGSALDVAETYAECVHHKCVATFMPTNLYAYTDASLPLHTSTGAVRVHLFHIIDSQHVDNLGLQFNSVHRA